MLLDVGKMYHDMGCSPRVLWNDSGMIAYSGQREWSMKPESFRIAYLIDDLSFGGAQKQLALIVEALPEPFVPLVCCLSESTSPFGKILVNQGVEVLSFRRRSHFDLLRLISVTRTLARYDVDIIQGFLDASSAYAYLAGWMLRKPTVLTLRSDRISLKGLRGHLLHAMYKRAAKVMVNSKAGETYLLNYAGLARDKVELIRNWFPPGGIPPRREVSDRHEEADKEEIIGYVGRFSTLKRLDMLIHAFRKVSQSRPDAKLVLIGQGEVRDDLETLRQELGLTESVDIREPVIDVIDAMKRFSCFVLSSSYEGLPNVVIEALAAGIPVVAGSIGDVRDLVINGRTGVLVEEITPDTLADAISKVLSDPALAESAKREGPRLVSEHFSIDACVKKLLTMYEGLLGAKSP